MPSLSMPEEEERRHEEKLANAILEYLAEHPQASDSLEGIAEWWIMRQLIRVEVTTVARVLRQLTKSGLLEEEIDANKKSRRYRLKTMGQPGAPEEKHGIVAVFKRLLSGRER